MQRFKFKTQIPLFSWQQIYNLYFLLVVKKTFNSCLKDKDQTFEEIEGDLLLQKAVQKRFCGEIFDVASRYSEFDKIVLIDSSGNQNIENPVTKDFYRSINGWSVKQGWWKKSANTSGSSGISLKIIRSPKAFLNSQISFYQFFAQFGITRFDTNIYVGGARKIEGSILKKIANWAFSKITGMHKFVATDMVSDKDFDKFIQVFEKLKPTYIQGFSSALLRIADYIEREKISLKWVPKLVHPSAEGLTAAQRETLARVFGCNVAMVYGSAECHMASECSHGIMHVNMRSCDLKTKSNGSAILTVFESEFMPLVNYQMGDILKLEDPSTPCKCGKHTTVIKEIIGRLNDKIVLPSGRVLTHPDVNMLIEQIDTHKLVKEYQIINYIGTTDIEFRYLSKPGFDEESFARALNDRFSDVSFFCSKEPFSLLDNGKKPVMLSVSETPLMRRTYDTYNPYSEISESQSSQNDFDSLKLDWNESTIDFPSSLKSLALDELAKIPFNVYPDLQVSRLKVALANWLSVDVKSLTVFNGSDAGIATICRLFLEDTDATVTIEPTYGNYRAISSRYTKNVKSYQLDYPFVMDVEHFSMFLEMEIPKLVFFTNPNNPTGVEFPRQSIFELAKRFPRSCFVIDEAYVEFGENTLSVTEIPGNVIILRTFSKAFGLAGIRLGYSISTKELAVKIGLSKDNKEVDVFAQIIGEIAVKNPSYMFEYLESVERGRAALINFFESREIPYLSGKGNFMLFKVEDPFEIDRLLKLSNVYIRNRTEVKNLKGYLRVTLGDEVIMKKFITLLRKII